MPANEFYFSRRKADRLEVHRLSVQMTEEKALAERHFRGMYAWPNYDSKLVGTPASTFEKTFAPFVPMGLDFREYIEAILDQVAGEAIGIEFGGNGSNLFADFSEGFFARSLGVNLVDKRGQKKKDRDNLRHHQVVAGDFLLDSTKAQVLDWLGAEKVRVIFERMGFGLKFLPWDPYVLSRQLSFMYEILAEGGAMFIQVPDIAKPLMRPWVQQVHAQNPALRVRHYSPDSWDLLEIRRSVGAPASLPLLTPRQVRYIYESQRNNNPGAPSRKDHN